MESDDAIKKLQKYIMTLEIINPNCISDRTQAKILFLKAELTNEKKSVIEKLKQNLQPLLSEQELFEFCEQSKQ